MSTKTSEYKSMDDLLAYAKGRVRGVKKSQKVKATFIDVDRGIARFDIGGKTEAIVSGSYFTESKDFIKTLKKGQSVAAVVMDPEDREGRTILSLKHAAADLFWKNLQEAQESDELVSVLVKNVAERGLGVELSGNLAFIPFSQLKPETVEMAEDLIDKRIKVKVLEVDKPRLRVVLSERAIEDAENLKKLKEVLASIPEGTVLNGTITTITSFGVFVEVEIEGKSIEGLVHVSELSWGGKVSHPSEMFAEGDTVSVVVLGTSNGKLSLSIKKAQEDPWTLVADKYKVDDRVTGTVAKLSDYGVFVTLEDGIEGLIHITKIPPATKLNVGDTVNCYIEEIQKDDRKISLGIILTSSKPVGYK